MELSCTEDRLCFQGLSQTCLGETLHLRKPNIIGSIVTYWRISIRGSDPEMHPPPHPQHRESFPSSICMSGQKYGASTQTSVFKHRLPWTGWILRSRVRSKDMSVVVSSQKTVDTLLIFRKYVEVAVGIILSSGTLGQSMEAPKLEMITKLTVRIWPLAEGAWSTLFPFYLFNVV